MSYLRRLSNFVRTLRFHLNVPGCFSAFRPDQILLGLFDVTREGEKQFHDT